MLKQNNILLKKNKVRKLNDSINFNSLFNDGVISLLIVIFTMDLLGYNFWQFSKSIALTIYYPALIILLFFVEFIYKCLTGKSFTLIRHYVRLIIALCVLHVSLFTAYSLGYLVTNINSIFVNYDATARFSALSAYYILIAYLLYINVDTLNDAVMAKISKKNDISKSIQEH